MRAPGGRRTHPTIAILLGSVMAVGSAPWTAYAAPPKPPAAPAKPPPAKKGAPAKPAKDEPKRAEARKNYADAEAKLSAGDYEGAFALYKAANDTLPAPQTMYKMALCLDKLDRVG